MEFAAGARGYLGRPVLLDAGLAVRAVLLVGHRGAEPFVDATRALADVSPFDHDFAAEVRQGEAILCPVVIAVHPGGV